MVKGFFRKTMLAGGMATGIGSFAMIWQGAARGEMPADLVVLDAKVLTVAAANPRADAFAVRDGRFVAVGRSERHGASTSARQLTPS